MYPYQNPQLSVEERVADLLQRMTLREKIGQLTQRLYGFTSFVREGEEIRFTDEFKEEVEYYSGLGTLYGLHRADPWSAKTFETGLDGVLSTKATNQVQKYVIEHSRLGIPALLSTECPHGHQALDGYLLPVNLAAASTFDPELLKEAAKVAGAQLKEMGIDLALLSVLDILRDPRWGRSEECYGEDPYLACRMGEAVIQGIQSQGVDVTAKHMCGQGETTGGVNASAARIGQRELREIHLPPVKNAVEAGVTSFMAAYNEVDGVYCHGNPWLLTDVHRGEYGFTGFVMSDGCAIDQLDAVTGDRTASGALALNAGVDMGLWDTGFRMLDEALERGLVTEEKINEACGRILSVKFRRGLFENPYVPETDHWRSYNWENYPQVKRLAEQTPILLKNSGILPLSKEKAMKIALVGPNADAIYNQLGDYTPPIHPETGITLRRGLRELLDGTAVEVKYYPGCPMYFRDETMLADCVEMAKDCDVILNVVGGSSSRFAVQGEFDANGAMKRQSAITMDCGENVDNSSLELPGQQYELLQAMKALGKPVITVVIAGRPHESWLVDQTCDALVYSFYPGLTGGEALAKVLFGEVEPAGRLNASLPNKSHQLPCYYNHKDSYAPMRYFDGTAKPKYGFGCGMGYTTFDFALVEAPTPEKREVTLTVTNTGSRPGYAVPQLYIHRTQGAVTSRWRQLCGFTKLYLESGESKTVTIAVPEDSLRQFDYAMKEVLLPGKIEWFLCDSGETKLEGNFVI